MPARFDRPGEEPRRAGEGANTSFSASMPDIESRRVEGGAAAGEIARRAEGAAGAHEYDAAIARTLAAVAAIVRRGEEPEPAGEFMRQGIAAGLAQEQVRVSPGSFMVGLARQRDRGIEPEMTGNSARPGISGFAHLRPVVHG